MKTDGLLIAVGILGAGYIIAKNLKLNFNTTLNPSINIGDPTGGAAGAVVDLIKDATSSASGAFGSGSTGGWTSPPDTVLYVSIPSWVKTPRYLRIGGVQTKLVDPTWIIEVQKWMSSNPHVQIPGGIVGIMSAASSGGGGFR